MSKELLDQLSHKWRNNRRFAVNANGAILLTDFGVKDLTEKHFTPADWRIVQKIIQEMKDYERGCTSGATSHIAVTSHSRARSTKKSSSSSSTHGN